jgi:hypothetical protein
VELSHSLQTMMAEISFNMSSNCTQACPRPETPIKTQAFIGVAAAAMFLIIVAFVSGWLLGDRLADKFEKEYIKKENAKIVETRGRDIGRIMDLFWENRNQLLEVTDREEWIEKSWRNLAQSAEKI